MKVKVEFDTDNPRIIDEFVKFQKQVEELEDLEEPNELDGEEKEKCTKKFTLEFNATSSDDNHEFMQAITGYKAYMALWDFSQQLRLASKYSGLPECYKELEENECCNKVLDKVREVFYNELESAGVDLNLIY